MLHTHLRGWRHSYNVGIVAVVVDVLEGFTYETVQVAVAMGNMVDTSSPAQRAFLSVVYQSSENCSVSETLEFRSTFRLLRISDFDGGTASVSNFCPPASPRTGEKLDKIN